LRQPEVRKHLFDIAEACALIERFTAGRTFEDYEGDPLLRSGVERQFEIVGEALSRMLQLSPDLLPRVTDARRIVAFRNRLIHGYASVSNEVVWGVVEGNLPVLQREIQALLEEP
jgi:uncharacterized protein with HEPN domain